jgi:hypothetical protein
MIYSGTASFSYIVLGPLHDLSESTGWTRRNTSCNRRTARVRLEHVAVVLLPTAGTLVPSFHCECERVRYS